MNLGAEVLRAIERELEPYQGTLIGVELIRQRDKLVGRLLWKRENGPIADRPYVTHAVGFDDEDRAVLVDGQWDLDENEAADAWSGSLVA